MYRKLSKTTIRIITSLNKPIIKKSIHTKLHKISKLFKIIIAKVFASTIQFFTFV